MSFQSLEKVHAATMAGFMAKLAVLETALEAEFGRYPPNYLQDPHYLLTRSLCRDAKQILGGAAERNA
jgi:hypothetical protein